VNAGDSAVVACVVTSEEQWQVDIARQAAAETA